MKYLERVKIPDQANNILDRCPAASNSASRSRAR